MQIGIYTTRPELMRQLRCALDTLGQSAFVHLDIHQYDSYQALSASLTDTALDLLLFDMENSEQPQEYLSKVMHTIPNSILLLLCDDTRYALFGYTVRARDYLTTPLDPEDLLEVLTRFLRERIESHEHYLPLKMNGVWGRLNMHHIVYIESAGHSLIFHMNDGRTFRVISSFANYQTQLNLNRDFFRCHKSYVVNMRYVTGWELNNLTLFDGRTVNISRPYRQLTRSFYVYYTTQTRDTPDLPRVTPETEDKI